jgi:hypothetical protein
VGEESLSQVAAILFSEKAVTTKNKDGGKVLQG